MSMDQPLPHAFGDFSFTMDESSAHLYDLTWLPPPTPLLQQEEDDLLPSYQRPQDLQQQQQPDLQEQMEEVKKRRAAMAAHVEATRKKLRRNEHNIADLKELARRDSVRRQPQEILAAVSAQTAEKRDRLQRRQQELLAAASAQTSKKRDRLQCRQQELLAVAREKAVVTPTGGGAYSSRVAGDQSGLFGARTAAAVLALPSPVSAHRLAFFDGRTAAPVLPSSSRVAVNRPVLFQGRTAAAEAVLDWLAAKRPLPQQGHLLQTMMEAAPPLQNLLLAGPLPRWRTPPKLEKTLAELPDASAVISPTTYNCASMGSPWSIH